MTDQTAPIDLSRRKLVVGGLLLATAGIGFARLPRTPVVALGPTPIDEIVPTRVGPWRSVVDKNLVMPPEDERAAAAVYEDQLARTYLRDDGGSVMLMIAYARKQSGMLMVHRPESCYPGSGFKITADRAVDIPLPPNHAPAGRFLSTARAERIEQVLYWTRLGRDYAVDWDDERTTLATYNLRGLIPDGALIRLSTISPDPAGSFAMLRTFAAELFRVSGAEARALLVGP